ncbi:MAG TPA: TOBE domain-containing protein [Alphaproteobacteria bacterium]|jgi:molybdopterin-binding protein|nr:TOBE domain-containing protein [Alphaproteobacteria bacterium]
MKISARNQLKGKVVSIARGSVMAKVVVDIGGGNTITAAITGDSVDELGLKVGSPVAAVIKATEVMIAIP